MCVFSAPVLHIGVLKYSPTSTACAAIFFSRKIPLNFLDPSIWFDKICLCPPMNYTLLFSSGYCAKKYQLKGSFILPCAGIEHFPPRGIFTFMSPYFVVTSRVLYDSQSDNISLGAQSQPTSAHTRCERYLEKPLKKHSKSTSDTMLKKEPFFQIKFPFSMLPLSKGVENSYYEPFFESFVFINWKRVYLKSQN